MVPPIPVWKVPLLSPSRPLALSLLAALALAGCQKNLLLVKRSVCPAVAVPNFAGDTTLFAPGDTSNDARAVDVVATLTELRGDCNDATDTLATTVSFKVIARRTDPAGARAVTLPFFATIVQGGNLLVSKQVGTVTVNFADGQARAEAIGGASARIARSAAALPPEIQERVTRKRKAGDLDAATDPLADPEVRAAVRAASFEVLVGFQLGDQALAYNVTK